MDEWLVVLQLKTEIKCEDCDERSSCVGGCVCIGEDEGGECEGQGDMMVMMRERGIQNEQ